jgi:hypothetical protein
MNSVARFQAQIGDMILQQAYEWVFVMRKREKMEEPDRVLAMTKAVSGGSGPGRTGDKRETGALKHEQ